MKFFFSVLALGAAGLANMVLAGDFIAQGDDFILVTSVPGGAYYAAAPGGCAGKIADAGPGYLYDIASKTANNEMKDKGPDSAHVFSTGITTQDPGRWWAIDVAKALPYDWATSYIYYLSGSRDGMDEFTIHKPSRVMPGGTFPCTCGNCKDDPAFGTNSVVVTYTKSALAIVPVKG